MGNVEFKEDGVAKVDISKVPTTIGKRAEHYLELLCSDPDVKRSQWNNVQILDYSDEDEKVLKEKKIFPYTLLVAFKTVFPYCTADLKTDIGYFDFSEEFKKNAIKQANYFSMILGTEVNCRKWMDNDYGFIIKLNPMSAKECYMMEENQKLKQNVITLVKKIVEMENEISAMPGSEDYFAAKGRFESMPE